ncbi:MAG: RimK/LysX family protein [Myxococcales bacterium]|jgi:hypothetical protein
MTGGAARKAGTATKAGPTSELARKKAAKKKAAKRKARGTASDDAAAPGKKVRRKKTDKARPVIGWVEHVDLPNWRVFGLRAKSDTGARSSSLHVYRLSDDGPDHVRFDVVIDAEHGHHRHRHGVRTKVVRRSRVRSSNGQYEERIFVRTLLRVGSVEREIEISLADRREMTHRMLLGRTSLKGLLVDPTRQHLLSEPGE